MEHEKRREGVVYLENFTSRKDRRPEPGSSEMPDSLSAWVGRYLELAVVGMRSRTVAEKAALHLGKFVAFFGEAYGHHRVSGLVMLGRLSAREKLGVYALLIPPRPLLAYALLQVNPGAAHAFAGDAEMDARFDRVYNRTRPALHCRDDPAGPKLQGLGFYANQYPQSASGAPRADFLPTLAKQDVPTLVIKGQCDYLSWSSAAKYVRALPEARLVYLDGAGHNAYQDEPERYMETVRTFLMGDPLPERPHTKDVPPDGYEGSERE